MPTDKPHFIFVIPLRNPAVAQDWERCVKLCVATLCSTLNQNIPRHRFRVILVCQEFPDNLLEHPCLEIIRHPFPEPASNWEDQHHDKYLKIRHGLVRARDYAPCYVMKLDADDLVSARLAEHVLNDNNRLGYYVEQGYRWRDGSRYFHPAMEFYKGCGSSNILYAEADTMPANVEDDDRRYDLIALGHNITVETFARRGTPLGKIPFPATIYRMGSGENITAHFSPESSSSQHKPNWKFYLGHLIKKIKKCFFRRRITSALRDEFCIPKADKSSQVPVWADQQ